MAYSRWGWDGRFYIYWDTIKSEEGIKERQSLHIIYENDWQSSDFYFSELCEMVEKQDFSKIVGYDEVEAREQRTVRNAIDDFIEDMNAEFDEKYAKESA